VFSLHQVHREAISPHVKVRGQCPQEFFFSRNVSHFWVVFGHMVFADGFRFSVKLGLFTIPGH
jgi:hypothetical protein